MDSQWVCLEQLQLREVPPVTRGVQRVQPVGTMERVTSNKEINQQAFRLSGTRAASPLRVFAEPAAGFSPNILMHVKFDSDAGIGKKRPHKICCGSLIGE